MNDTRELEVKLDARERERWLAARLTHLTGTDIAQIVTGDEMKVYLDKHRLMEREEAPEHFYWGNRLQPAILEGYADRLGVAIEHANPYDLIEHPDDPLLSVSLDARWVDGDKRPVDAKNIGVLDSAVWGAELTAEIPEYYFIQLQQQMAVTKTDVADLAVLFGGRRLRIYRVERDESLIQELSALAHKWWEVHVVNKVQPPVTGSETWLAYLGSRPQTDDLMVEASESDMRWVAQLREARVASAQAEAFENEAKAHIIQAIAESAGMAGPGFKITYKQSQPSRKTDWQLVSERLVDELVSSAEEVLSTAQAKAAVSDLYRKIVDEATVLRPGSRRFLPSWKEN